MTLRTLDPAEHSRWDRWLATTEGGNLRQAAGYGEALRLFGHASEVIVSESEDSAFRVGALLGAKRVVPMTGPLLHTSGGVALADAGDAEGFGSFLEALIDRARHQRASALDVFVRVPFEIGGRPHDAGVQLQRVLERAGFQLHEPFDTYFIRLAERSPAELLASFGKNPRRHIRKADREGLRVEPTLEPSAFDDFEAVHGALCRRKGLAPLPSGMARAVLQPLAVAGLAELHVATFRDQPRNYLLASTAGIPLYAWGALADAARERGCPQTGQALHYGAMCRWLERGLDRYDFGGTPADEVDESNPNYAVWKFKREFQGEYARLIGGWRRVLRPAQVATIERLRDLRSRLRR